MAVAWNAAPTVTSRRKHHARITGSNIPLGNSVTIGLPGDATATTQLPAGFPAAVDAEGAAAGIALEDIVAVRVQATGVVAHPLLIHVTKGGAPWQISIVNDDGANATPDLEVEVEFIHSAYR